MSWLFTCYWIAIGLLVRDLLSSIRSATNRSGLSPDSPSLFVLATSISSEAGA